MTHISCHDTVHLRSSAAGWIRLLRRKWAKRREETEPFSLAIKRKIRFLTTSTERFAEDEECKTIPDSRFEKGSCPTAIEICTTNTSKQEKPSRLEHLLCIWWSCQESSSYWLVNILPSHHMQLVAGQASKNKRRSMMMPVATSSSSWWLTFINLSQTLDSLLKEWWMAGIYKPLDHDRVARNDNQVIISRQIPSWITVCSFFSL